MITEIEPQALEAVSGGISVLALPLGAVLAAEAVLNSQAESAND